METEQSIRGMGVTYIQYILAQPLEGARFGLPAEERAILCSVAGGLERVRQPQGAHVILERVSHQCAPPQQIGNLRE